MTSPSFRPATLGALLAGLFWALTLGAQEAPETQPAPSTLEPPAEAAPSQDGPEELSRSHRTWLEEVSLIIRPEEREVFEGLSRGYQRDAFIRRFWQVRDPFPQTTRNELKDRWDGALEIARQKYPDLADTRAQMMLLNGEPERVLVPRCPDILRPLEIWYYPTTLEIRGSFYMTFVKKGDSFQLWYPTGGVYPLLAPLGGPIPSDLQALRFIETNCFQGAEVALGLSQSLDWERVKDQYEAVRDPGSEWVRTFEAYSTDVPEGAETFPAKVELSYPGRLQSRTLVQGLVTIDEVVAGLSRLERSPSYNFVLDGEVLRQDELFEHFRYRFNLKATADTETAGTVGSQEVLPLVFQRYLRPGPYTLILKIQDTNDKAYFRQSFDLQVPRVEQGRLAAQATQGSRDLLPTAEPGAPGTVSTRLLSEANANLATGDHSIRLRVPRDVLLIGKLRVHAAVTGDEIRRVRFSLNGRPVFSKARPPYSVELDLGRAPRTHVLRATAHDTEGRQLAVDEVLVNAGPHRFAVRLIEPQRGKTYNRSLRANAVVEVPESETLDRLEFFLNDDQVATLYQPPWVQPILIPEGEEVSYVRVAAFLKDGLMAEDAVFVNAPDFTDEMAVQFVELYTSVLDRRGRPLEDLTQEEVTVLEDGSSQEIRRFEKIVDTPIHAGILLDTSNSMLTRLDSAVDGALRFFETVIRPQDRASVITFSEQPNLAVRFTNDLGVLAGGLAGLTAEGDTALYDSLIYGLYYFSGITGKRAILLLSDGADVTSRYTYDDVIAYARRTGVAIYAIGIGLLSRDSEFRDQLAALSEETGGRSFFVDNAKQLAKIYESIEDELRSQYLIAYQSNGETENDDFRRVEVEISRPGAEANTISGYFP